MSEENQEVKHYRIVYQNDDVVIMFRTEAPAEGEEE